MSALPYRPDIDGLRAIAVLLVVLFHADLDFMGGGFIGVDVFFVISGYLITSLLLKERAGGNLSLGYFWERRARRILPALTLVTLLTLLTGAFVYLPGDYAEVGRQAMAQSAFGSNILFYLSSGYFAPTHDALPLLHTWSLAVEEQFYLLYPFLFLLLTFGAGRQAMPALITLALLSLGASIWAVKAAPDAAFYLLPFRAWELLLGALLAFGAGRVRIPASAQNIGGLAGLLMILAAGILFDKDTPFPGAAALLPCLGAGLVIFSSGGMAARLLSWKPLVFTGLVSYSWYLWHWPVLMMAEYVPLVETNSAIRIALVALSFGAAILSWKYVEQPFRRMKARRAYIFILSVIALTLMAASGFAVYKSGGMPARWSDAALAYDAGRLALNPHRNACNHKNADDVMAGALCQTNVDAGAPSFILWGDSFADAVTPAFFTLSKEYGVNGYIAVKPACPPILGHRQKGEAQSDACLAYNDAVLALAKQSGIRDVLMVGSWNTWTRDRNIHFGDIDLSIYPATDGNLVKKGVMRTVDMLRAENITVHIALDPPAMPRMVPRTLAFEAQYHVAQTTLDAPTEKYEEKRWRMEEIMASARAPRVNVIDPLPLFCPGDQCMAAHGGNALFFDRKHLSAHGAAFQAPLFAPVFEKIKQKQ